jgi:hypothetical protein
MTFYSFAVSLLKDYFLNELNGEDDLIIIEVEHENVKIIKRLEKVVFKNLNAGHEGIEPPTLGFGDRCST